MTKKQAIFMSIRFDRESDPVRNLKHMYYPATPSEHMYAAKTVRVGKGKA